MNNPIDSDVLLEAWEYSTETDDIDLPEPIDE